MATLSYLAIIFITLRQLINYFNLVLVQKIYANIHRKINIELFASLMNSSTEVYKRIKSN